MSEDRISDSPNPPRCPVCATGFTSTPGASCPACGRVFAPRPEPSYEPDFRLKAERFRFDDPSWIVIGVVFVSCVFLLSWYAPGILIPLGILLVPALIRTVRLRRGRADGSSSPLFASLLASLGVTLVIAVAASIACLAVCAAVFSTGSGFRMLDTGLIAGGFAALVVFVWLFVYFWPRPAAPPTHESEED